MATIKNKIIENFFNKKELNLIEKYCANKFNQKSNSLLDLISFSPQWYDDALMTSFLDIKLPMVEKESKLKLFPTYAYWRYYIYGGMLPKHIDRPSCEVSVSVCIKKYSNYDWPIIVEGKKFELNEGDAVLYNGLLQKHWRPGVYKGEGMIQVFFHYINKSGNFTNHKYDNYYKTTGKQAEEKDIKWMKKQ